MVVGDSTQERIYQAIARLVKIVTDLDEEKVKNLSRSHYEMMDRVLRGHVV